MADRDGTESLLVLRKLTRAIADAVRTDVTTHLTTLAPLLRPQTVLSDFILGGVKENTRRADQALKEVKDIYEAVAPAKPFNLRRELTTPFNFSNPGLEITPVDYVHHAVVTNGTRAITVRSPLTWTVSYAGYAPTRLAEVSDPRVRGEALQQFILSHILLHVVTKYQKGVTAILDELSYPVTTAKSPDLGDLPLTRISVPVSTERPGDDIVIESAGLTGIDAFEEVVKVSDLASLREPFKERLLAIARESAPALATF
jgi:hypothetical protein